MKHPTRKLALFLGALAASLALSALALAQGPSPAPAPLSLNPPELLAVCSAAYAVLNSLASAMRADNTATSWAPPLVTRVVVVVVGGSVQAALLLVTTGTPWYVVVPAAAFTTYAAWMAAGKRVAPGAGPGAAAAEKTSGRPPSA